MNISHGNISTHYSKQIFGADRNRKRNLLNKVDNCDGKLDTIYPSTLLVLKSFRTVLSDIQTDNLHDLEISATEVSEKEISLQLIKTKQFHKPL